MPMPRLNRNCSRIAGMISSHRHVISSAGAVKIDEKQHDDSHGNVGEELPQR